MDDEVAAVMSAGEEVVECLCGLNTSDEKPLAEIAAAFSRYVTAAYFDVPGRLQTVWLAFFDIVGETPPEDQKRLVDFVLQLRKTTAENASGQAIFHEIDGHLWYDLPGLTTAARDYWNFSNVPPFINYGPLSSQLLTRWIDMLHMCTQPSRLAVYDAVARLLTGKRPNPQTFVIQRLL